MDRWRRYLDDVMVCFWRDCMCLRMWNYRRVIGFFSKKISESEVIFGCLDGVLRWYRIFTFVMMYIRGEGMWMMWWFVAVVIVCGAEWKYTSGWLDFFFKKIVSLMWCCVVKMVDSGWTEYSMLSYCVSVVEVCEWCDGLWLALLRVAVLSIFYVSVFDFFFENWYAI